MKIEWQLPVRDDTLYEKGYTINPNAKVHCFVDGKSLCGKYYMVPDYFDTVRKEDIDVEGRPEVFCKVCREKYLKLKNCSKFVVNEVKK